MHWAKLFRAAAFAAALTIGACATTAVPPQALKPLDIWPQEAAKLEPDAAVKWGALPNGLRYAIMPNAVPTRSVAIRMRFGAGSLDEKDDQQGIAHFLEHMAFNGSKNVPEGDMVKILERFGLAFGPDTNAFTSFDQTVYQLDLPSNGDEIVDQGLFLMNETARNLTLAPDSIDRERGVILSEERVRDTPSYRAYLAQARFLMPDSRLVHRFPIGQRSIISGAPAPAFEELYHRAYRPDRATLVVVGDVDSAKLEERIKAVFGDWGKPAAAADALNPGPVAPSTLDAGYFQDPAIKTSISISAVKPARTPRDTVAERKHTMTRDLADAILSRRLRALARQGDAKILGGASYFDEAYEAADMSVITISAEPKLWRDGLSVAEQELRRALTYGFTEAEIAEQISEMRSSYKNAAEYAPTRKTPDLADALIGAAHDKLVFTHPAEDLALFEAWAKGLKPADLLETFKADWTAVEPKIFISTSAVIDSPRDAILAVYKASQAVAVTPPEKASSDAFAYSNFGAPGVVAERKEITDLAPGLKLVEVRFANNVRLNIIRTAYERDTVRMEARICCGDLDLAKSPAGFSAYLQSVFGLGGLEKHSADDLERLNAGRTAEFGLGVDEDAYTFSGVVIPADLEWQLQIWAAQLTAPGYRQEAQAIFQKNVAVWLETLNATPQSVLSREMPAIVRSGDPRWTIPDREAFEAFKLDQARAALTKPLASGAMEIAIVGDVDEQAAIDAVARTLGALPARDAQRPAPAPESGVRFPPGGGAPIALTHAGPKNRGAAEILWPVGDFSANPTRGRRLRLLTSVMELKLNEEIRERLGETYSPSADLDQSEVFKGYGYMDAGIDLEPEKLAAFYDEIAQIARDMAAGKISDDEFLRAQKPIVEGLSKSEERNEYWLRVANDAQFRPETLDWHRSRKRDYSDATLAEIKALAKEVLKDKAAVRIQVLPAP